MATDYDAPRTRVDTDPTSDGGVRLDTRRSDAAAATLTVDDDEAFDGYASTVDPLDLLDGQDLTVPLVAQRRDEFTCTRCFLIHHRSRYSRTVANGPVCCECT